MDEINKLTLFDDDDVSISWIDENLVDVYKGLIIDFNTEQPYLLNADMEFPEFFEPSWLENELNRRILREIDNAEICPLGIMDLDDETNIFSINDISSGSKALMLCNMFDNVVIWGPLFDDNSTDILLEICNKKTIKIVAEHLLEFNAEHFRGYSVKKGRMYENLEMILFHLAPSDIKLTVILRLMLLMKIYVIRNLQPIMCHMS